MRGLYQVVSFYIFTLLLSCTFFSKKERLPDQASNIKIDLSLKSRSFTDAPIGLSLNQLNESAFPLTTLKATLKNSGIKYLRFPEGESADNYLWSKPPYEKANPRVANVDMWPGKDSTVTNADGTFKYGIDFDAFMDIVQATDAHANIVLCYPCGDKNKSLELAKHWVKYANITKKYGITNWELGNESYLKNYNGESTPVEDYAHDLIEFSTELKKVDPKIRIGANGDKKVWWEKLLAYKDPKSGKTVAESIDFLVLHNYPMGGSLDIYSDYLKAENLTTSLSDLKKIINNYNSRLTIAVTETNALSFKGQDQNNLGTAIVVFDMIGQLIVEPKVEFAQMWTSHWVQNKKSNTLQSVLDSNNNLSPIGKAVEAWGAHLQDTVFKVSSDLNLTVYGSFSADKKELTLFLINKIPSIQNFSATIDSDSKIYLKNDVKFFSGKNTDDSNPVWSISKDIFINMNKIMIQLQPTSITLISLKL